MKVLLDQLLDQLSSSGPGLCWFGSWSFSPAAPSAPPPQVEQQLCPGWSRTILQNQPENHPPEPGPECWTVELDWVELQKVMGSQLVLPQHADVLTRVSAEGRQQPQLLPVSAEPRAADKKVTSGSGLRV